ncbi:MAG: 1-phosphofructokinase [Armatimonadota bacterium]
MIATVTLNPAIDKCVFIDCLCPNDTNRIYKVEVDAGGKGVNVSRVLKELGSETITLGFIGGHMGRYIEHVLRSERIRTSFTTINADTRTNIAIQEASGIPPTSLNEPGPFITAAEQNVLTSHVKEIAWRSKLMIFGGSLPSGIPVDIYQTLIESVKETGVRIILDSDGEPMRLGMKASPFMIKPNRDEVKRLVGVDIQSLDDAKNALNLLAEFKVQVIVISMGAKGAITATKDGVWHAVPPEVKVVSTIGSGDSMVAGMAHIFAENGSVEDALRWGSAAGAATAMTNGAEICRRTQIIDLLDRVVIKKIG